MLPLLLHSIRRSSIRLEWTSSKKSAIEGARSGHCTVVSRTWFGYCSRVYKSTQSSFVRRRLSLLSIYSTHVVTPTGWTLCNRANGSAQWEGGNVYAMMPSSQLQCTATVASSSCRIAAKGSPVGALVLLSSLWFVASSSSPSFFVVAFFPLPRGSRGDVKKGEQGRHQKLATNKRTRTRGSSATRHGGTVVALFPVLEHAESGQEACSLLPWTPSPAAVACSQSLYLTREKFP